MIYLDYAATTPMSKQVIEMYEKVASTYIGNASSIHDFGSSAKQVLDTARDTIAAFLNAPPRGLFFTGSGSEANSLAIRSLALGNRDKGRHIISTKAEHSCVRNTLSLLEREGFEISYVPLDQQGFVDMKELETLIRPDTILVTIHHGNSEIGTVQNMEAIGEVLSGEEVLFHSDCVQSFGKREIDIQAFRLDSLAISAHKIYGPKGVGAAYIRPSVNWKPVLPGTTQEKGFRAGTANVPGVAAFMAAAQGLMAERESEAARERALRVKLMAGLDKLPFEITFEGPGEEVLPNILGMRIHGMEGQYAMLECNRHGLAISTGSACSAGSEKAAASMTALGRSTQEAREFIRLSTGRQTTMEEIDRSVDIIGEVLTEHFDMVKH